MTKRVLSFVVLISMLFSLSAFKAFAETDDETEIMPGIIYSHGDVNRDKKINIKDVTCIQKYLAKLCELSNNQIYSGDVDGRAGLNIKDATHLQKWLAHMVDELIEPRIHQDSLPATDDSPIILPVIPAR